MFNSPPGYAYDDQGRPVPVCGFDYPAEAGQKDREELVGAEAADQAIATIMDVLGRDDPNPEKLHVRFHALRHILQSLLSEERSLRQRALDCNVGASTLHRELARTKEALRQSFSERVNRKPGKVEHENP